VLFLHLREQHQHLLPWPHMVDDRILIHVQLQRLVPRLVLFCLYHLQPYKHANTLNH
jgi:hypothetical protein